jgi:outer membrane protein TolC
MNKVNFIIFISITFIGLSMSGLARERPVTLKQCVQSAIANKASLQGDRSETMLAELQKNEAMGKYLPQLTLNYEYKYNPIIATQVIPTGQLLPDPTEEFRPIKFGMNWQQNAGLTLYQPILDFTIQSKLNESRINEQVKQAGYEVSEEDLKYDVLRSYANIYLYQQQVEEAVVDSARTFSSLTTIRFKFDEGKILKPDLNNAILNHNNAKSAYRKALSELLKEKLFMSYLSGISVQELFEGSFDFSPLASPRLDSFINNLTSDSVARIRELTLKENLLNQQIRSERNKYVPQIGLEGFLGANQYSQTFDPFLANSWYGSSYLGISLKMPLMPGESTSSKVKQLKEQTKITRSDKQEIRNQLRKDYLVAEEEIAQTKLEIFMARMNEELMTENLTIYRERFDAGKIDAGDLNLQELDLQKERANLSKLQATLVIRQVEQLNAAGNLNRFLDSVK